MNTYFLTESRDMIFDSKQMVVQNQALTIAQNLEELYVLTIENATGVAESLDAAGITYFVITDDAGDVLYPAEIFFEDENLFAERIQTALNGYDLFHSTFRGGSFSSGAFTPVISRGLIIGAVYVHNEDPDQGEVLLEMQSTLQTISMIIIIFSVVMVAFLIWSVMRRITSVLNAIKSVREGEYNYRINLSGNDELALLGDEFNSLTDRLRETDEIRRRFVADASHELKTPLASIRLLSDSILQSTDMESETVQEFVSDIGMEAVRLARTTEKLMTLTRLDSDIPDENRSVDVREVVITTLRMLWPLAQSYGISLNPDLQEDLCVFATEDSVYQVVFNLVENAIKYNKSGGRVSVRLYEDGNNVVLTVTDTGVGVPEDDLPYIFDRFYRVDKARSREAGGSGLGLAIVWDTVRELNGKVTAERLPDSGMSFQVRFTRYYPRETSGE